MGLGLSSQTLIKNVKWFLGGQEFSVYNTMGKKLQQNSMDMKGKIKSGEAAQAKHVMMDIVQEP